MASSRIPDKISVNLSNRELKKLTYEMIEETLRQAYPGAEYRSLTLASITSLNLQNNLLRRLPDGFAMKLPKLEWLNINQNRILDIKDDIITHLLPTVPSSGHPK
jgi:Leucine-rich repeat (LRR) protein